MKHSGEIQIAARYVSALFETAQGANRIAQVEKDLLDLAAAVHAQESLAQSLASPLLNRDQQRELIAAIADAAQADPLTKAFLLMLASQRRLGLVAEIARQFRLRAETSRGELSATLVLASPIDETEMGLLVDGLSRAYGKKIRLTSELDAALLGGVVVKVGGQQLDASLAGKLERLNIALKAA